MLASPHLPLFVLPLGVWASATFSLSSAPKKSNLLHWSVWDCTIECNLAVAFPWKQSYLVKGVSLFWKILSSLFQAQVSVSIAKSQHPMVDSIAESFNRFSSEEILWVLMFVFSADLLRFWNFSSSKGAGMMGLEKVAEKAPSETNLKS